MNNRNIAVLLLMAMTQAWAADAPTPKAVNPQPAVKRAEKTPAAKPANDQLTLDPTLVTGNRELPKVMYIVPWKKADLGNLPGQPFNTLVDEVLAPVDREVFRREVEYYQVIAQKDNAQDQSQNSAPNAATPAADKK